MVLDHVIPKPPTVTPYQAHQMIKGLTGEAGSLFADNGVEIVIRTEKPITKSGTKLRQCHEGDVVGFELRACVSKKRKGKHIYPQQSDWKSRHAWLDRQGEKHGFEILTVNCHASQQEINDGGSRKFNVDKTDFVGVLRVIDEQKFNDALVKGIGSTARTFGFGMLII